MSSSFDRFKESLDRGVTGRESLASLDLVALRELDDLEREKARQLLAQHLDDGDPRIVDALAELDRPKAWADVERAFVNGWGSAKVHAAMYLWMRQRDPRVVPALRDLVKSNPNAPTFVIEVLAALGRIEGTDADEAILEAFASTHLRVVGAAADVIFTRHKWDQYEHEGAPIFTLRCGLTSSFPSVRAQAMDELRALLQRKQAGESDAQLGIVAGPLPARSPVLQELTRLAFQGTSQPVPDNQALDTLSGGERDWAIDLLLGRLEADDRRVIPALTHLGGERVRLALADHQAGRRIQ
jgi:hypothetical protein